MDAIDRLRVEIQAQYPQMELREEEAMSKHTSFRIGGPVSLLAMPTNQDEAATLLRMADDLGLYPFFLGKGSNLLVADEGMEGLVIQYNSKADRLVRPSADSIRCGAGMALAQVALFAMEQGLTGMEFAHGIPGSVGGAVVMNAGAYGGEMSQIVTEVTALTRRGEVKQFRGEDCQFAYRHSIFSEDDYLIVSVDLSLKEGNREAISEKMNQLMEQRRSKQPLAFPSAGSTFKRPPGYFAGSLIEAAGLKGASVGGAQVSEKHAGFVVNTGGASCEDVLRLMRAVRQVVAMDTGVTLEPEIRLIGCAL